LRAPNRNGRIYLAVASAISGGICAARLLPILHRFGLPVQQGRTGKNVHLNAKTGHSEPLVRGIAQESDAFSIGCEMKKAVSC
jgi:hypothetical protein